MTAAETSRSSGIRSSQRIRNQPVIKAAKKLKPLEMLKGDTVKHLKIRVRFPSLSLLSTFLLTFMRYCRFKIDLR